MKALPSPPSVATLLSACLLAPPALAQAATAVTVDATARRTIGGVGTLDRARFFGHTETFAAPGDSNLGDLRAMTYAPGELNTVTGRSSTDFDQTLAETIREDPSRPGFIDPDRLRAKLRGSYRDRLQNGTRWEGIRAAPDPLLVQSGRYGTKWPAYVLQPGTGLPRADAYAEFLGIYLEEVVYGPNAYLPMDPSRFHIELVNEPDLHFRDGFTPEDLADYHRDIARAVKARFPQASIGGPGLALTHFEDGGFGRNQQSVRTFLERAGDDTDFFSLHPYERYDTLANGEQVQALFESPGRVAGTIDLIQAEDQRINGRTRQLAFTEYGSFNQAIPGSDGDFGNTPRDELQWQLARDVREKLHVFLDRPDAILNAVPFIAPVDFDDGPGRPTRAAADNVMWERDAAGNYSETILGSMYRSLAPVRGDYVDLVGSTGDLQTAAFRDGNRLYVLLNNLLDGDQAVDLDVLAAGGGVASATIDRVYRSGGRNVFIDDADVSGSLGNLTLSGEEGAVLTLTLTDDVAYARDATTEVFYGRSTVTPLTRSIGRTGDLELVADLGGELLGAGDRATLRVSYGSRDNRPNGPDEGFEVVFNGQRLRVPPGLLGIDDGDHTFQSRLIDVPIELVNDGLNVLDVDFTGNSGFVAATSLTVTRVVSVPEPGTALLLGGVLLLGRRRRRARTR
ncbi:PEP-CTERM sorting domain-containing protein [Phycisphaera mikurensis]|uniref:Putative glycoside hydrolase n=1 Tax=Phycisphaera mikurensis (strain NBRC 102666 / KCTC 22515 / FYK2301M01) TaxID=1142394 RepID=I0IEU5_PHYMF|nr:PEP-CTERM sorting domain-containing protein [Phycisphaera mikurensis]MBB6441578.1 hypothetical protein [Phycisphaera mikurensis]BAM03783.1 putative glycoside hydrolase [Phycisphaera mikurensis NBRC 102666]